MAYGFQSELKYPSLWHLFSGDKEDEEWWEAVDRAAKITHKRYLTDGIPEPDAEVVIPTTTEVYENSCDSFCYELAWYKYDSDSESDAAKESTSTAISTTDQAVQLSKRDKGKSKRRRPTSGHCSVASCSPMKLD